LIIGVIKCGQTRIKQPQTIKHKNNNYRRTVCNTSIGEPDFKPSYYYYYRRTVYNTSIGEPDVKPSYYYYYSEGLTSGSPIEVL
jgi:hypothetical protein